MKTKQNMNHSTKQSAQQNSMLSYPERDLAAQLANFDGKISIGRALPYGIQHVLAMFVANLAPIAIIAAAAGFNDVTTSMLIQNAMIIAGIGTFIQLFPLWRVGARMPIVMGVSFTYAELQLSMDTVQWWVPLLLVAYLKAFWVYLLNIGENLLPLLFLL